MKIPLTAGGEINTDNLSDIQALISEKSNELINICKSANLQCITIIERTITQHVISNYTECKEEQVNKFWRMLNWYVETISKNTLCIKPKNSDLDDSWKNA